MPPKAQTVSKKTEQKRQEKVIEDKTFGLKNKNKSKTVQNYVKSVASQVKKLDGKGGESKRIADEFAEKAAKKKEEEKKALLSSLFKTVKKTQEVVEEEAPEEEEQDDRYEELDLYTDQREQIFSRRGEGITTENDAELDKWNANKDKTDKICKFFLDAVEDSKYGWRWVCPNGMGCMYKHALPPGYTLKREMASDGKKDDVILEEQLERERICLTGSTPVTFERFMKWKEDKRIQREKEKEAKRLEEAKKGANKGGSIMSGRALFTYDPTLFQDDADALDNEELAEEIIEEENEERKEEEDPINEEDEEEETEQIEDNTGDNAEEKKKKKKNKKKDEDNVKINEDVFLDEGDIDLPDDE